MRFRGIAISAMAVMLTTTAFAQTTPSEIPGLPPAVQGQAPGVQPGFLDAAGVQTVKGPKIGAVDTWIVPGDESYDEEYIFRVPEVGLIIGQIYREDGTQMKVTGAGIVSAESPEPTGTSPVKQAAINEISGLVKEASAISSRIKSGENVAPQDHERMAALVGQATALARAVGEAGSDDEIASVMARWKAGAGKGPEVIQGQPPVSANREGETVSSDVSVTYPVTTPADLGGSPGESVKPAQADPAEKKMTAAEFFGNVRDKVEKDGFYFSSGSPDAPAVYVMMDPTCPICAKLVDEMRPDIEAGKVQLRIVLTPVLSRASLNAAADILSSPNPQQSVLDHAKSRMAGPLAPKSDFDQLPEEFKGKIAGNVRIMTEFGLPGVPVTLFTSAEGAEGMIGYDGEKVWEKAVK